MTSDQHGENQMNAFTFSGIGPIVFGISRIDQLADDVATLTGREESSVVLISDSGLSRAGMIAPIESILTQNGCDVNVYNDLQGEPHAGNVDAAADLIRQVIRNGQEPCIIGLGGGSALDTAKLAAVIALDDASVENYALCAHPLPKPQLKLILIPTTAGTGSEVTRTAVYTAKEGRKVWAWGEELLPHLVLLDPELTVTVPTSITAASGIDVLVHAIEACTGQNRMPISDGLGLHAIRLAHQHLVSAILNPSDLVARGGMLLASTLAGSAINVAGTGVAHALGHALATLAHVPHGVAVAVSMDATLEWNAMGNPEAYAAVAQALGAPPKGVAAATAFRDLLNQTGLDRSLNRKAIAPETLAEMMLAEENRPMVENNARPITADDAMALAHETVRRFQ